MSDGRNPQKDENIEGLKITSNEGDRDIGIGKGNYNERVGRDVINIENVNIINTDKKESLSSDEPASNETKAKNRFMEITVAGEFREVDLETIQKIQRELTSFCRKLKVDITLVDAEEGSIKLTFEGSEEDLEKLKAFIESKQITELAGKDIENVELIKSSVKEKELRDKRDRQQQLIQEIRNQKIKGRDLRNADFRLCDLRRANLNGAYLSGANLSFANLFFAKLNVAYLSGADLSFANLSGANLNGADLSGADLSGADLNGAILKGANLSDAYLINANLKDANLSGADLSFAYLSDANLNGANLSGAYLSGAYLINANLIGAQVNKTIFVDVLGLSRSQKQNLKNRGAIVEDSPPGDRSKNSVRA